MQHFYFVERPANVRKSMKVIGFTNSLVPSRKLVKSETVHIHLTESELSLYLALSESNRKILRRAQKSPIKFLFIKNHQMPIYEPFNSFIITSQKKNSS